MFKKDSTNSSNSSGTFEVDVFKAIRSLQDRVTALEKSEKSTSDFMSEKVKFRPFSKLFPGPYPELASSLLQAKLPQIDKTQADDEPISSETSDFVEQILSNITFAINEIRIRLAASSNSKDIERYSKSILYLSIAYKNFK